MKRILFLLALALALPLGAQEYEKHFTDSTLRLDYVFCGDATHQDIFLVDMYKTSLWAGRRHNLQAPLLRGNGLITVRNSVSGETLYANSFSTLFQEWQATQEATHRPRSFETCLQVPFPKEPVDVEVTLNDIHAQVVARLVHRVDPSDMLIRAFQPNGNPVRLLHEGSSLEASLDVVILGDGYVAGQEEKFFADAARVVCGPLFLTEPYTAYKDRFNIRAVFAPSQQEGPSIPHEGVWTNTAADSHYDTFYSARYLTTSSMRKVYDALGIVPFEHIILLVNNPRYGGGGIYNNLTIASSDDPTAGIVFVHEFGHAFAGLADEYAYDEYETMYPADTEPWEPNITTLKDFGSKWADMLPAGTPIPTPRDTDMPYFEVRRNWRSFSPEMQHLMNTRIGVYEGAGNSSKGVYRPVQECRMRMNECDAFCPVCQRAIARMIEYYTR